MQNCRLPALAQRAVGRSLHQARVDGRKVAVGGIRREMRRRRSAARAPRRVHRGKGRHRGNKLVGDLPSDHGAICELLGRGKTVEARHQRGRSVRRYRGGGSESVEHVASPSQRNNPISSRCWSVPRESGTHPGGARICLDGLPRQRLVHGDAGNEAGTVATPSGSTGRHRQMTANRSRSAEAPPHRDDQQNGQVATASKPLDRDKSGDVGSIHGRPRNPISQGPCAATPSSCSRQALRVISRFDSDADRQRG